MQLTKIKKDGKTSFNIQASAAEVMALEAVLIAKACSNDETMLIVGIGLIACTTPEKVHQFISILEKNTGYNLELVRQFRSLMINEPVPDKAEYLSAGVKS